MDENNLKNYQTFPITPWYTEKNSYLKIYKPKEKQLKCGLKYTFEMIIKTPDLESFIKSNIIYFQLQSRSNFSFVGLYDIQNEKLSVPNEQNKIFFDIKLIREVLKSNKESSDQSKLKKNIYFSSNLLNSNFSLVFFINGNPKNGQNEYTFELSFDLLAQMSPRLSILAYFIYQNEIIPDSLEIDIPKCFENKVKI